MQEKILAKIGSASNDEDLIDEGAADDGAQDVLLLAGDGFNTDAAED